MSIDTVAVPPARPSAPRVDGALRRSLQPTSPASSTISGKFGAPVALQADDVAVLLLVELAPGARLWGWSRVVLGERPLRGTAGLRFAKALGSGQRGGFGLRPSLTRQGLFAVFDGEAAAEHFLIHSDTVRTYRERASEFCSVTLRATSSRGHWGGQAIGVTAATLADAPVAALTRASIRPSKALRFWRHSPPAEAALQRSDGCVLAMGLGEAPLLRQATFSLWRDQAAMDAYARSGAHLGAIRAAHGEGFFSESMFVRFVPLQIRGIWQGHRHG